MKFRPGQSGNRAGRPPGIVDQRARYRALLEPHAESLMEKVVELALGGDTTALRLCIERLVPAAKPLDSALVLPPFEGSLGDHGRAVIAHIGAGRLTPDQGSTLMSVISSHARVVELDELERRVADLERLQKGTEL